VDEASDGSGGDDAVGDRAAGPDKNEVIRPEKDA
jgi:hypothetical protein